MKNLASAVNKATHPSTSAACHVVIARSSISFASDMVLSSRNGWLEVRGRFPKHLDESTVGVGAMERREAVGVVKVVERDALALHRAEELADSLCRAKCESEVGAVREWPHLTDWCEAKQKAEGIVHEQGLVDG